MNLYKIKTIGVKSGVNFAKNTQIELDFIKKFTPSI